MADLSPPKYRRDFEVAMICALQLEADAVEALFDYFWDEKGNQYGKVSGDQNSYRTGVIGNHNVVLAYMPGIGKGHAASVSASLRSSFEGIRLALIVGICGGVPNGTENGIFLGDIVIGESIVVYDFGRKLPGAFRRKDAITDSAGMPNTEIQGFLTKLKTRKGCESLQRRTYHYVSVLQKRAGDYYYPGANQDRLFESTYHHKHRDVPKCKKCNRNKYCKKAQEATCERLQCSPKSLVLRSRLVPGESVIEAKGQQQQLDIHFGRIASGDTVMKSGEDRDRIASREKVIAFEMEGAGICNNLSCIVVKGVSDYADSHKDKVWQRYAAGTAAACARSLLEQWSTTDHISSASIMISNDQRNSKQREGPNSESGRSTMQNPHTSEEYSGDFPLNLTTHPEALSSQPAFQSGGDNENEDLVTDAQHSLRNDDINNDELLKVLPTIDSRFRNTLACFKQYRKYLPRDVNLKSILRTQSVVFSTNVEILLSNALGSSDTHGMTAGEDHTLRQHKSLGSSIKDRLASSIGGCLDVTLEIQKKLAEIEGITRHLPVATEAKIQKKMASDTLKDTVEDLKSLVQVFSSLIPQHEQLRLSDELKVRMTPRSQQQFWHFRIIQQAARSLYDALGTACNAYDVHHVHLSLQPSIQSDLNGTRSEVQFTVAFSGPALQDSRTTQKATWINVESIIRSPASSFEQVSSSVSEVTSSRQRQSQVEEISYPRKIHKRVQSQPLSGAIQSSCPGNPPASIPNLYLQRNFCTVVERFLHRPSRLMHNDCIGLLGDDEECKHFAYINNQTNGMNVSVSLSQVISLSRADSAKGLGLYERVRLARCLATAVLYYHTTPWLNESWRSDDVHFFGGRDHDHILQQVPHTPPYMSTSIRASSSSMEPKDLSFDYNRFIRNPVLFGLGIMFLELAYQAPLRDLQEQIDLNRGESQSFADYFTAQRLAERSNAMVSQGFKIIVKKCLHCDFGHDSNFKSRALQEAFYHDVIGGLEKLEKVFQDLQLDDPEPSPGSLHPRSRKTYDGDIGDSSTTRKRRKY